MRLVSLFWSKKEGKFNTAIPLGTAIQEKLRNAIQADKEDERSVELLKTAIEYVLSSGSQKVLLSLLETPIKAEQKSKGSKILPSMISASAIAYVI
ncbi:MAG: hypothetical protein NTX49_03415 [Chlamydiae bacterium]|nr:hypothetical protein [Chlamydiota bacterium]